MINVDSVSKTFGGRSVLTDISFSAKAGDIVAVLGQSDSGKTTLLNIISGCMRFNSGTVTVDGVDVAKYPREARAHIGYMPEGAPVYPALCAHEYLELLFRLRGIKGHASSARAAALVEQFGLDDTVPAFRMQPDERRMLAFAGALAGDHGTVILDMPTTGADPTTLRRIRMGVRSVSRDKAVIFTTSSLHEALDTATSVLALSCGRVSLSSDVSQLRSSMAGTFRIHLRLAASLDCICRMQQSIADIKDVNILKTSDGIVDLEIEAPKKSDIQRSIWRYTADNDMPILEMKSLGITEEDIYLRLSGRIREGAPL